MTNPPDTIRSRRWTLETTTWVGVLGYAEHYYGHIERRLYLPCEDRVGTAWSATEKVDLDYVMDEEQANRLSSEDYTWEAGDSTGRFFSREEVVAAAVQAMGLFASEGDWLEDYDFERDEDVALWGTIQPDYQAWTGGSTLFSGKSPLVDEIHYLCDKVAETGA